MTRRNTFLFASYFFLASLFAAWTWILTAPNLVLTSNSLYWQVQNYLHQHFYPNRLFVTSSYIFLIVALLSVFLLLVKNISVKNWREFAVKFTLLCLPFLFSYNALSYDVFNYLFNAKMVIVYHANPHTQTALDFAHDDWTRFMHNTHTAAPYGYGWTIISLLPYLLFAGKFTLIWWFTRFANFVLLLVFLFLLSLFVNRLSWMADWRRLALFFFNPLILIELLTNSHNDLWMMLPAVWSLLLIYPSKKNRLSVGKIIFSLLLLLFSLSIKFATVMLVPSWLFLLAYRQRHAIFAFTDDLHISLQSIFAWGKKYFFDLCALLMFVPLLTARSQFFHPWYLTWSLVLLPFARSSLARGSLLVLSVSSLLRYAPYLWENGYTVNTLFYQQLITFVPFVIYLLIWAIGYYNKHRHVTT